MPSTQSASEFIGTYNAGREPERLAIKFSIMRSSPFGFMRGSAPLYWKRVAAAGIPAKAPAAWCSCDQHLENFGTYRGDNGLVYFDLNDFDEAALAPCDWEITRLLVSILVAAPTLDVSKADARDLAKRAAEAYHGELLIGKARWIERKTATGAIDELMLQLKRRPHARLLDRRTIKNRKGGRKLDLESPRLLPLIDGDRDKLAKFATDLGKALGVKAYFNFIDGARRIAGTGSLGLPRYVLLLEGTGGPDGNVVLDLKAAQRSSMVTVPGITQPKWPDDAQRVVTVQRLCQAISPGQLRAVSFGGAPFVLKELQPEADRLKLARIAANRKLLTEAFQTMGQLVAWSQLRSSGRNMAASADDLIGYAEKHNDLANTLLAHARELTRILLADYKDFAAARDKTLVASKAPSKASA
jgi:uncharacterized protein (DUF2252 family)